MKSVRKLVKRASNGQLFNWWEQFTITPGTRVDHPKRGPGTVKLVNPDDDQKVHVEFATGDTHRYAERSWAKFTNVRPATPRSAAAAQVVTDNRRLAAQVVEVLAMIEAQPTISGVHEYLRVLDGPTLSALLTAPMDGAEGVPGHSRTTSGRGRRSIIGGRQSMSQVAVSAISGARIGAYFCDELLVRIKKAYSEDDCDKCVMMLAEPMRLATVTNAAKARLIRSIAHAWDDPLTGEGAIAVRLIVTSVRGAQLVEMKRLFEETCVDGGAFDLTWLIFKRLDEETRIEVLAHIMVDHVQGAAARTAAAAPPPFQLLSDIDDTFYCSFLDRRVPRHTLYPGVIAFYREMQRGQGSRDLPVFLSARPRGYNSAGAVISIKQLQGKMAAMGLTSKSDQLTMLLGTVSTGIDNKKIALKKFVNFRWFKAIHPELHFAFVGDNGQGDHLAGEMMLRHFPGCVEGVFIHNVKSMGEAEFFAGISIPDAKRMVLFNTYARAARGALELGMIASHQAAQVASAVLAEVVGIDMKGAKMAKRADEAYADVVQLNAMLPPAERTVFPDAFVKTMSPARRAEARAMNKQLIECKYKPVESDGAASGGDSSTSTKERDLHVVVATDSFSATDVESEASPLSRFSSSRVGRPAAWWFQDGHGAVQGPCKHDHMLHWLQEGLLHATTLVTPASPGVEAVDPAAEWHSLSEIAPAQAAAAQAVEDAHVEAEAIRVAEGGEPPTHWWFQDSDGAVQGPCTHENMIAWLGDGALTPETLVSSAAGEHNVEDVRLWHPLADLTLFSGAVARGRRRSDAQPHHAVPRRHTSQVMSMESI